MKKRMNRGLKPLEFSPEQYRAAAKEYNRTWCAQDKFLSALCRKYPGHSNPVGIYAKVCIIGRTYMTGIERNIKRDDTQRKSKDTDNSITKVIKFISQNASRLKPIFKSLSQMKEPLTEDKLRRIIRLHGRFVSLIEPISRGLPRSFCSKYMHFHCSAVPIYDSQVAKAIRRLVLPKPKKPLQRARQPHDKEYTKYVLKFWELYKRAKEAALKPTVRHLDCYLKHLKP